VKGKLLMPRFRI